MSDEEQSYGSDSDVDYEPPEDDGTDTDVGGGAGVEASEGYEKAPSAAHPNFRKQISYDRMDKSGLIQQLRNVIASNAEMLGISDDESVALLLSFQWKEERLRDAWFEGAEKLRKTVGVTAGGDPAPLPPAATDSAGMFDPVTYDEIPWEDTDACACGHRVGKSTWRAFCEAQIKSPNEAITAKCVNSGEGCKERVRRRIFKAYLDEAGYAKYEEAILRSYVNTSLYLALCPTAGCDDVVYYAGGGARDVTCSHGHNFCFRCKQAAHRPALCMQISEWVKLTQGDAETGKWLLAHTKPCPKCKKPIEKNDGCIHMTCRTTAGGCGHEFCWLCAGDWATHGGYSCNKPPPKDYYDGDRASKAMEELKKLAFYEARYQNHRTSGEHAVKLAGKVEERITLLLDLGMTPTQAAFLREARELVIRARNVAQYSYVRAFFMKEGPELALFQDFQGLLEDQLERLQEVIGGEKITQALEAALAASLGSVKGELMTLREQVVSLANATARYIDNVLSDMDSK